MDTLRSLVFFGESLKLDSVWDYTVNMKFNVFYSTFTEIFKIPVTFFNVFNFILNFFISMFQTMYENAMTASLIASSSMS